MRFAFYVSNKPRTRELATALAAGARVHGDEVVSIMQGDPVSIDEFDGGAVLGMARAAKRLFREYVDAGKRFMLFDKGYMDRDNYWRVSVDAWQPLKYFAQCRPSARLERLCSKGALQIQARRPFSTDGVVLVAGTCQAHNNFHDLGDVTTYHQQVVRQLRPHTEREIVYRPNPSWFTRHHDQYRPVSGAIVSLPTTPFPVELRRTHLLVTHGSSAAFGALAAGVPIMVLGEGIGSPMALGADWARVNTPYWPGEKQRYQFFCDVSYCQWTNREYASGEAWADLRATALGGQ